MRGENKFFEFNYFCKQEIKITFFVGNDESAFNLTQKILKTGQLIQRISAKTLHINSKVLDTFISIYENEHRIGQSRMSKKALAL